MDLIEVLWKQDVDLGFSLDTEDPVKVDPDQIESELVKSKEAESKKLEEKVKSFGNEGLKVSFEKKIMWKNDGFFGVHRWRIQTKVMS